LLSWKKQMNKYDTLAKKPAIVSSFKKTLLWVFVVLILGLILLMVFLPYILSHTALSLNVQSMFSFLAGAWILMWGTYLQLIYWEKKNHLKIYIKSEKGFQKMYVLGEKEGKL
jgi:membrane protein CcdC involved in cytochrome C biogenesis